MAFTRATWALRFKEMADLLREVAFGDPWVLSIAEALASGDDFSTTHGILARASCFTSLPGSYPWPFATHIGWKDKGASFRLEFVYMYSSHSGLLQLTVRTAQEDHPALLAVSAREGR